MNYIMGAFECKMKKFKCNSLGSAYGTLRQEELGCLYIGKPVACIVLVEGHPWGLDAGSHGEEEPDVGYSRGRRNKT